MTELKDEFEKTIVEGGQKLAAISQSEAAVRPQPGKWSPKEIVGHLIDSAANNHARIVRAQAQDDLLFDGYDQEHWVNCQHYQEASWPSLILLWQAYNRHLLFAVSVIDDDTLIKPRPQHSLDQISYRKIPTGEPATLKYLIRDYLDHMQMHLQQIYTLSSV